MEEATKNTYVSRAGHKLEHALEYFGISVSGLVCADLGAHTGGFTDCLLQRGAAKVYAVETGKNILAWKLRQDPRVVVMEKTNALHVQLPEKMDFIASDVGWTPQGLVLPHALTLLKEGGSIISLLKPHYEAPPNLRRGGRMKEEHIQEIIDTVTKELTALGVSIAGIVESPLVGQKGANKEFLFWIKS